MRSVGRAEALAAVALAVGSRLEPVAALRRLAAEDPDLRVLDRVADRVAAGEALGQALAACRLVARRDAERLAGLAPEVLAAELARLGEDAATAPPGEILARWLPLWAALAAIGPSLAIGAAVAAYGGWYGGIWQLLGVSGLLYRLPIGGWFAEAAFGLAGLAVVVLAWVVVRAIPGVRHLAVVARRAEEARQAAILIRAARAGRDAAAAYRRWARFAGDRRRAENELAFAEGDVTAALIEIGLVPRGAGGHPDWAAALAEADLRRAQAAAVAAPGLVVVVAAAGIIGFTIWGAEPMQQIIDGWARPPAADPAPLFVALAGAAGSVLAAHLLMSGRWLLGHVAGPARDWPLVAGRVARTVERRGDVAATLRGLRVLVQAPMRERLDAALSAREAHPGRRLAEAGVAPPRQRAAVAAADAATLPAVLRAAAEPAEDHGLAASLAQAGAVAVLGLGIALIIWTRADTMQRMLELLAPDHCGPAARLLAAAGGAAVGLSAAIVVIAMAVAAGRRLGWWDACWGWRRLSTGLAAREALAAGHGEMALAQRLRAVDPRLPATADAAAACGDLPGVLAAAGWRARDAAALDRAIAGHLTATDRRRARLGLAVRLVLPVLLAVPVALAGCGWMLGVAALSEPTMSMARVPGGPTGGSMSLSLMHWMLLRRELYAPAESGRRP